MKIRVLSILILIGLVFAIGVVPVYAGEASGNIDTGANTGGTGGVVNKTAPIPDPLQGTYSPGTSITFTAVGTTNIYYIINNSTDPITLSSAQYTGPIPLNQPGTYLIRVAAYYADSTFGPEGTYTYNIVMPVSGGGAGGGLSPVVNTNGDADVSFVFTGGTFKVPVTVTSNDAGAKVEIGTNTTATTADGSILTHITVTPMTNPPAPPAEANAVALYYDFGPSGVTFGSPVTITLKYDPSKVPAGTTPYIAWYNKTTGQWEKLTTVVVGNSTANPPTISATVNHFTAFSVFAAPAASPTPTNPTPTATVSPTQTVSPTPTVSQTPTVSPTLPASTTPVTTLPATPTQTPNQPAQPFNWWILVIVVVAVIVVVLVVVMVTRRRAS